MAGEDRNIEIVGPIDYHESNVEFQQLPEHSVLVFDFQPHRDAQYQMLDIVAEYFVPPVVNKFLEDIFIVSNK
jgi:polysaccharide biosynthesis PFTS motif protein